MELQTIAAHSWIDLSSFRLPALTNLVGCTSLRRRRSSWSHQILDELEINRRSLDLVSTIAISFNWVLYGSSMRVEVGQCIRERLIIDYSQSALTGSEFPAWSALWPHHFHIYIFCLLRSSQSSVYDESISFTFLLRFRRSFFTIK